VQIQTTRFGMMEIEAQMILHFPSGLLGFPGVKDYVIFDHDQDVPFKWLQAVDVPDLAFLIMDPFLLLPDYQIELWESDHRELGIHDMANLSIFVILTVPAGDPTRMTANMRGPVVVNGENRSAKQLVLVNSPYHTRHPLLAPAGA